MSVPRITTRRMVPSGAGRDRGPDRPNREAPPGALRRGRRPKTAPGSDDPRNLHARGVGEILDIALDVLFARFAPCVGFATLFLLPLRVAGEALSQDQRMLWQFTYTIPELLTAAFVCSLVGGHFLGKRVSAAQAFREGLVALPGVAVIALVQVVVMLGLFCMCVAPVVLGYWAFAVVPTVYVLDRARLRSQVEIPLGMGWILGIVLSIARGLRLVFDPGALARWMGWSVVAMLAVYLPLSMSSGMLDDPSVRFRLREFFTMDSRAVWFTLATIGAIFAGIGTAYLAILKTVYYLDQRVRREALDLELRLEALRGSAPARRSPGPAADPSELRPSSSSFA